MFLSVEGASLADVDSAAREAGERQLELARQLVPRVLADAATAGFAPRVELELDDWDGICSSVAGTVRSGHSPGSSAGEPELLAWLADTVQEDTMEGDQVHCLVWPVCPAHGLGGHALVEAGTAVWWCNGGDGHLLAPVGELGGSRG